MTIKWKWWEPRVIYDIKRNKFLIVKKKWPFGRKYYLRKSFSMWADISDILEFFNMNAFIYDDALSAHLRRLRYINSM